MRIAVLSGKGGTGKTTVSASIAASLPRCQYIDCDVEEPNGYIFLSPEIQKSIPVKVLVPQADMAKCNECGSCGKACQFNAIAVVKGKVMVFPEICHHCGACAIACPVDAICEVERPIGVIEMSRDETFIQGRLNVGEPISIPIIRQLKEHIKEGMPVVLDCSPGASCSVVQSVEGCDYCILVTEPTPFGFHDLKVAVKLVEKMEIPFGVVVNKSTGDDATITDFCGENNIQILMDIPFSKELAKDYSRGVLPVHRNKIWKDKFRELFEKVERGVRG